MRKMPASLSPPTPSNRMAGQDGGPDSRTLSKIPSKLKDIFLIIWQVKNLLILSKWAASIMFQIILPFYNLTVTIYKYEIDAIYKTESDTMNYDCGTCILNQMM